MPLDHDQVHRSVVDLHLLRQTRHFWYVATRWLQRPDRRITALARRRRAVPDSSARPAASTATAPATRLPCTAGAIARQFVATERRCRDTYHESVQFSSVADTSRSIAFLIAEQFIARRPGMW